MCADYRPDVRCSEFPYRPGILLRQSTDSPVRNPLAVTGAILIVVFVLFAVFAPWLAPQDPARIDLRSRLSPPSAGHWFGTDELGRDIFSRVIFGARVSMLLAGSVVLAS